MKAWLRKPARLAYRLLRPFVRPIAFRVRGFLLGDVQRELSEVRREAHELLQRVLLVRREARDFDQSLREVLDTLHRASGVDRSELSAEIIQEVQASRSFLEADIFNLSARIVREFRGGASPQVAAERAVPPGCGADATVSSAVVKCDADEVIVGTEAGCLFCKASERESISALTRAPNAQQGTLRLIRQLVRPGDLFIDVGPGAGLCALAAARAMQGRGRVVAYEPCLEMARLLEKSVMLNGFSDLIEIYHPMRTPPDGEDDARRGRTPDAPRQQGAGAAHFAGSAGVEEWLAEIAEQVDGPHPVAAIRVGTHETALIVLHAIPAIARHNLDVPVIGEFAAARILDAGTEWSALLAAFAERGFDCREIDAGTGALAPWTADRVSGADPIKILFARTGSPLLSI